MFTELEIATIPCVGRGRYVLVHQYQGTAFILCEVIVIGNQVSGKWSIKIVVVVAVAATAAAAAAAVAIAVVVLTSLLLSLCIQNSSVPF